MTEMIRPLWNTNYDKMEDLRYESLPCHRTSFPRWLNSVIEKSEAREACMPSLPSIPIPISASKIMPTSLPPSPIAAILLPPVYPFKSYVTSAFWVGEHLQIQTHAAWIAILKKSSCKRSWLINIVSRDVPSITKVTLGIFLFYSSLSFCLNSLAY